MRRNGFTMVELIFVIIIIGILSVAAIPKFGDIKDRAKVNSEYKALSGLDASIEAAIQFHDEDYGNTGVKWHNQTDSDSYAEINTNKKVLSKIVKKGDDLKIVAYIAMDENGTTNDDGLVYDVVFIEGTASDHVKGVKQKSDGDVVGKPDKNDVWVFNTSPVGISITGTAVTDVNVSSGEMTLIDANTTLNYNNNITVTDEAQTIKLKVITIQK